jgi:hypothetical protein
MDRSMIRRWVLNGANSSQPPLSDVDPALVYDDEIFRVRTEAMGMVTSGAPVTDVRIVTEVHGESSLCIVADGTDPVTGMRHRQAWVFELDAGQISRIILTSSAQIPEKPFDGSLPLRPVSD